VDNTTLFTIINYDFSRVHRLS